MRLGVLTTGRQDWGILRSTCRAVREQDAFDLRLVVGGMHLSARYGVTAKLIEEEGFRLDERLAWLSEQETSAATQAGDALRLVAEALERQRPDALLLVGDRYETAAAGIAATLARVPIVHLHGGEETEGAFDNAFRHAITKLAHLHLVAHADYARRLIALGEDAAAVHVVGAPGLDNVHRTDLADRSEIERALGRRLAPPLVVVTLHPTTLGADPAEEARAVTAAMVEVPATYVITLPNSDPGNAETRRVLVEAAAQRGWSTVAALGERRYWGLLKLADAMLGNSSSALIEAPVLALPAVNVGDRQKGRLRGANVIDAPVDGAAIRSALERALSADFRAQARAQPCPFGDGRAAQRIVRILQQWKPPRPPVKPSIRVIS